MYQAKFQRIEIHVLLYLQIVFDSEELYHYDFVLF